MILSNASSLLCRHNILLSKSWSSLRLANVLSRASSLSAIHRGLRDSEKARPQGFQHASLKAGRTSRQRRDPNWTAPTFKLSRGKKDVTDEGPQPMRRSARFYNPGEKHGKKSVGYQAANGGLREKLASLAGERAPATGRGPSRERTGRPSGRGTRDRMSSDQFLEDFKSSSGRTANRDDRGNPQRTKAHVRRPRDRDSGFQSSGGRNGFKEERGLGRETGPSSDRRQHLSSRDRFAARDNSQSPRTRQPPANREDRPPRDRFPSREDPRGLPNFQSPGTRQAISNRDDRPNRDRFPDKEGPRSEREFQPSRMRRTDERGTEDTFQKTSTRDDGPVRVHHTTAASQFLYGRSVVEAALKDSRRQLYRLYIYSGEYRRNVSQDVALERLAARRDVLVQKVDRDGQRMLDKMSGGRPHNGCILEASPLPQLPLKALGPLSQDPAKPGFSLELTHQSEEEAKVNGTSDFISYQLPGERKPFVLLLDSILDPGNLGAILRTAAFMGVSAVAITKHSSATMTSIALKASAGASEALTMFSINSTIDFLTRSKESGWMVYAAVPSTSRSRGNSHLTLDRVEAYDPLSTRPTILVVGSEGEGLTKQVRREADFEVSIPSHSGLLSVVDSLNVSVATGILCSSFLKKQASGLVEIEESSEPKDDESQLW